MQVVEHPYSYEVRDDNGRSVKHFYFRNEPANVSLDGRMTKKQAEQRARAFLGGIISSPPMPALRRFLRPWQVIEHDDSFEITDAAGLGLAVVHFEKAPSRQTLQKRLSKDEARRMARKVARLSALRPIEKRRIDPGEF